VQHGIKPFLEFSPNDRKIFLASAKYLRISYVQNEFRLNSKNFIQTSEIHGFTVLQIYSPKLLSLEIVFQLNFQKHKFTIYPLKLVGCLATWSPVLTLNPKILGSIPKQLSV
jgi:hypothetical protein